MSLDQLGGIRTLIDRMGLPPGIGRIIAEFESVSGPLEKVGARGDAEVRAVLQLVDGPTLFAAIVAKLVDLIPDQVYAEMTKSDEPEAADDLDVDIDLDDEATTKDEVTPPVEKPKATPKPKAKGKGKAAPRKRAPTTPAADPAPAPDATTIPALVAE